LNSRISTRGTVRYVRNLKVKEIYRAFGAKESDVRDVGQRLSKEFHRHVVNTFSGRIGIYIALKACNLAATDEVLIPEHISSCVVDAIKKVCKPTYNLSNKTRAMVVFHQFGYPQKMDEISKIAQEKNLMIVEDCAHSLSSRYKGVRIGSLGDAAVLSFSKIFPTILGGCLITDDKRILDFALKYLRDNKSSFKKICQKLFLGPTLINAEAKNYLVHHIFAPIVGMTWKYFFDLPNPSDMVCHLILDYLKDLDHYSRKRRTNLQIMRARLGVGYHSELEDGCEVVPFAVPYLCSDPERMREELRRRNILVGVNYFDMNRNILSPNFKRVLALPCHQDLSPSNIEYLLDSLKEAESRTGTHLT